VLDVGRSALNRANTGVPLDLYLLAEGLSAIGPNRAPTFNSGCVRECILNPRTFILEETRSSETDIKCIAAAAAFAADRESAMRSYQIRIVATIVSVAFSAPVFAQDGWRLPYQDQGFSRRALLAQARDNANTYPWCLQNYMENALECSYNSRAQCEATASGGLGQCTLNYFGR
jgi:Protein of unknown function (DUF3551)